MIIFKRNKMLINLMMTNVIRIKIASHNFRKRHLGIKVMISLIHHKIVMEEMVIIS